MLKMDAGTLMFITFLPFCEIFHKRFSLKSTHTYPSHDPCCSRLINVNFTKHTLLWIILTFPKNKHSSHQPKEGAVAQECNVMADGESVIVGSERDAGSIGTDAAVAAAASDSLDTQANRSTSSMEMVSGC